MDNIPLDITPEPKADESATRRLANGEHMYTIDS
jgi:hypothetical protein